MGFYKQSKFQWKPFETKTNLSTPILSTRNSFGLPKSLRTSFDDNLSRNLWVNIFGSNLWNEIFHQHLLANIFRDFLYNRILIWSYSTNLLHQLGTYYSVKEWYHRIPVIVQGGDSQSASQRDLTVFALCSLIDKRDASKSQLIIIAFSVFCSLMASWGLKVSLGATCILLCISIAFALYALYTESRTLKIL